MANIAASLFAFCFISFVLYSLLARKNAQHKLPPGPKLRPIVGNLFDVPQPGAVEYRHWLTHKDKYGPISSIQIMGKNMVILHDYEAAVELMEKKSKVTSSRPNMEFAQKFAGYGDYTTLQGYTDSFRLQRKLMHQQLGTRKAVTQYSPIQKREAGRLLVRLLDEPEKVVEHFKNEAGASILAMTYGYSAEPSRPDPLIRLVDRMMENFSQACTPLAWPVDAIPALKYVPEWFPGMSFKQIGKQWDFVNKLCIDIPYSYTLREMKSGGHTPSLVSNLVQEYSLDTEYQQLRPRDKHAIKLAAATLYGGGADTTVSTLISFILAMIRHPEVLKKAQEEIDTVVGYGRLPQFEHQEKLPYVQAVAKEALRWFPVAPMGVPHLTEETIEYRGYTIPKGTMLIPAIWWLLHDPKTYRDPEQFDPTRYIHPRDEMDPTNCCFGFGRRKCPGQYVAESSIFLTIAQVLACFNIENRMDESGVPVETSIHGTAGLISHPQPFSSKITPRSEVHRDLIETLRQEYSSQTGDSEKLQEISIIEEVLKE